MVMALARGPLWAALVLATAAIVPASAHGAPALAHENLDSPHLPERAIVRYEPGTVAGDRAAARASARVSLQRSLTVGRAELVSFSGPVGEAVARLERQAGVADAQPDYRYRATAPDTFFGELWGLADTALPDPGVGAAQAWATTMGAGQVIAVVDSGVDLTHPDLDGNLWSNPGELPNGSDDDGNGRIDDLHGFDFEDMDADPSDYEFHGTHVAGTAAAEFDNGEGIAGVAPDAEVMPVRVLDGNGSGFSSGIGEGIAYAAREGATVINLSLGGPAGADDSFMANAIAEADQRNVTVVAAAGNDAKNNDLSPSTPCTFTHPNLICVAAVNQSGALSGFSNFGAATVDVGGPGTAILSTKSDWQAPVFSEGFEAGVSPLVWDMEAGQNDIPWGETTTAFQGAKAATDSPGQGVQYKANSDTWLIKAAALSLSGRRGCRMHFDLRLALHPGLDPGGDPHDSVAIGALDECRQRLGRARFRRQQRRLPADRGLDRRARRPHRRLSGLWPVLERDRPRRTAPTWTICASSVARAGPTSTPSHRSRPTTTPRRATTCGSTAHRWPPRTWRVWPRSCGRPPPASPTTGLPTPSGPGQCPCPAWRA